MREFLKKQLSIYFYYKGIFVEDFRYTFILEFDLLSMYSQ